MKENKIILDIKDILLESKIKRFNSFLESKKEEYSIYNFFSDLHLSCRNKLSLSKLKVNCDHFIGNEYFEKISNKVDKMIKAYDKVNINDVELRLYDDVYDNISLSIKKTISFGVLNGYYYEYEEKKYNCTHYFKDVKKSRKDIICDIIMEIIYPTLFVGLPSEKLRNTYDSEYVTDLKWNCKNFDIKNYQNIKINDYTIKNKSKYTVERVIDMFKPAIICNLEGNGQKHTIMNIDKIENYIDNALECILPTIDYEDVIFDYYRYNRRFENRDTYCYMLKIILK